jgi:hypothetical protein
VLAALGNKKDKLVIDLSCRRQGDDKWFVAMNKWQTLTDMEVNQGKDLFFFSLISTFFLSQKLSLFPPHLRRPLFPLLKPPPSFLLSLFLFKKIKIKIRKPRP